MGALKSAMGTKNNTNDALLGLSGLYFSQTLLTSGVVVCQGQEMLPVVVVAIPQKVT